MVVFVSLYRLYCRIFVYEFPNFVFVPVPAAVTKRFFQSTNSFRRFDGVKPRGNDAQKSWDYYHGFTDGGLIPQFDVPW